MQVRNFSPADYAVLVSWYMQRGLDAPDSYLLPSTGVVVSKEGEDVAAAFMYRTDSPIAVLEGLISSPNSSREDRREAMGIALQALKEQALESGFRALSAVSSHEGVIDLLKSNGFEDEGQSTLLGAKIG